MARWQLTEIGFSKGQIAGLCKRGHLHPKWRGVFAVGTPSLNLRGRGLAAVLATEAPLGHQSACGVHGLLPFPSQVHVIRNTYGSNRKGLWAHSARDLRNRDVTLVNGLHVTSVPRTLLDIAPGVPEDVLFRATNEAQVNEVLDEKAVGELLRRSHGHHGAPLLGTMLEEVRIPVVLRSELERVFFDLVRHAGLPLPEANVYRCGYLIDFVWERARLVVEVDGIRFHENERARRRDPLAHNALQLAGYTVLRYQWKRLTRAPRAVMAELVHVAG